MSDRLGSAQVPQVPRSGPAAFRGELEDLAEARDAARVAGLAPGIDLRGEGLVELHARCYSRSKRSTGRTKTVAPPTSTSSG